MFQYPGKQMRECEQSTNGTYAYRNEHSQVQFIYGIDHDQFVITHDEKHKRT